MPLDTKCVCYELCLKPSPYDKRYKMLRAYLEPGLRCATLNKKGKLWTTHSIPFQIINYFLESKYLKFDKNYRDNYKYLEH